MYTLFSFLIVGLLVLINPVSAANPPEAVPIDIDDIFSEWDHVDSPGCAVGIYHNGQIVYEGGYGSANLDYEKPITPETVFYIGSVSKQFTAAAIALLIDRGDIGPGDDVRKYISELPQYERPIRVQDLVYHTSGLRDLYALMTIAEVDVAGVLSIDDKLDLIRRQNDLNFLPGDEYLYSNSGYTLMAVLVKQVTGKTLREFTQKNIFEPLGMKNTHFHDNRHEVIPNRALSYQPGGDNEFKLSYLANFEGVGPGGLYTTIGDLFLWDQNYYMNRLSHSPNFNELMHTKAILSNGDTLDYAYGLRFDEYKGLKIIGHGGSFMGFRAQYERIPEHNYGHAILCNLGSINPSNLSRKIIDVYMKETIAQNLQEYSGSYRNKEFDVEYNIVVKQGDMYIEDHSQLEGALEYSDVDTFRRAGWNVEFKRNNDGEITGLMLSSARARNVWFERI